MREKRLLFLISCLALLMVTFPYIYAFQSAGTENVFGGFLINPKDGNSYLAKMQQGYHGSWKFTLPYTAEAGEGAYLFLFYLGLGHLARIIQLPVLFVFHIARLAASVFFLWTIGLFVGVLFQRPGSRVVAFSLVVLGSGLGWIAALFGLFTSDFWVAEAFPFLSMYTNPHFTLGLGLMVLILTIELKAKSWKYFILGICLGIIHPFGVVLVFLVQLAVLFIDLTQRKLDNLRVNTRLSKIYQILGFGVGGGSILIYQLWVINTDPVLSLWNQQNITISPGWIDFLFSFSPCLFLALFGLEEAWETKTGRTLIAWAMLSILLIMFPWNLQRRFLTGLYIPLAGLSVIGIDSILKRISVSKVLLITGLFCLTLPTNLIVILSGLSASTKQDAQIYYRSTVQDTLDWIRNESESSDLFMSNTDLGLLIPSRTGRRVIYGHPFETINAEKERQFIRDFFEGKLEENNMLHEIGQRKVNYIVATEEEMEVHQILLDFKFPIVFGNDHVQIYSME